MAAWVLPGGVEPASAAGSTWNHPRPYSGMVESPGIHDELEFEMKLSRRVTDLPPYLFAQIDRARDEARERGLEVVSMGIADPDLKPPEWLYDILAEEIRRPSFHRYPDYRGLPELHSAIATWMGERFGVSDLDPKRELITLVGGKEGVAHFAWAVCDPGDVALVPEPAYPVYDTNCRYAGAEVHFMPLTRENGFLPDLGAIPEGVARRAALMYLNYPNNPTGATAPHEFYQEVVDFATKYDIAVAADNPYSEVYYAPEVKPISILEIPGAKDIAVEFNSFSKFFNMTGWRIGWAAGNARLIEALLTVKSNVDSGAFNAIQGALARALGHPEREEWLDANRVRHRARRDMVAEALDEMGIWHPNPRATYYFWCRLPDGFTDSVKFASELLGETGFVVGPGAAYGPHGEGYFRLSITTPEEEIEKGMAKLKEFLTGRRE